MNKELIEMIGVVAYEKSMPKAMVHEAMEDAVAALARKEQKAPLGEFVAKIDHEGQVTVNRVYRVVDDVADPEREVLRDQQNTGEEVLISVPAPAWTRQGAQVVKQVLGQKLKQGLRKTIAHNWEDRVGDIITGSVKRVERDRVIIDLGEPVEGVLGGRDRIPGEMLKIGHRVRAIIKSVEAEGNAPVIELSRSSDDFLRELVSLEVPEVEMGQIILHGVARDPGSRSKVAVEAGPGLRHHPAAICIGMRGVRAQAISGELNGERVEFIEYPGSQVEFLLAALAPAEVTNIVLDEEECRAMVGVDPVNLARAIGARGQNVRLASRLTGWKIDLMSTDDLNEKRDAEDARARQELIDLIDVDEELADTLVREGFLSVEDISLAPLGDLLVIAGMTEELVSILQERAGEAVLLKQMADRSEDEFVDDVDQLNNISDEQVTKLRDQQINTLSELADLASDEVEWDENELDMLGAWIMEAREKTGMI